VHKDIAVKTAASVVESSNAKEDLEVLPITKETSTKPTLKIEDAVKAKKVVIVIDPGHGGKDSGAAGPNGGFEKHVVLKISKRLQQLLNDEPGFTAVLTRSTDIYLPLRKRLAIARKNHADMFIAVHADAYHYSNATGASVYALSQRGATSEAARWLAEKENESELGGLSNELADKDAMLRSVLIDLSQTHTIEASLGIGNTVLRNIGHFAQLHHPRVEQAAFVVLKSPDIPSILVETGFISNPLEEQRLTDPDYQEQTARAIKEGIKQYFIKNSPSGTWFAQNKY
jgi:N-acetylmuramoyl-L-alanine amidase